MGLKHFFIIVLVVSILYFVIPLIYESSPCDVVHCGGKNFGFWEYRADLVNITDDYALCQCPNKKDAVYRISLWRKY